MEDKSLAPIIKNFRTRDYAYHGSKDGGGKGYEWEVVDRRGSIYYHTDGGDGPLEGGCGLWHGDSQIKGTAQFVLSPDPEVALRQVKKYFNIEQKRR